MCASSSSAKVSITDRWCNWRSRWRAEAMRQIRVYGRGGQGVRAACRVLAVAFARAGWRASACGGRGDEWSGTPVTALVEVDDTAAALDDLIVFDPALLDEAPFSGMRSNGVVLVAAATAPCSRAPGAAA